MLGLGPSDKQLGGRATGRLGLNSYSVELRLLVQTLRNVFFVFNTGTVKKKESIFCSYWEEGKLSAF